MTDFERQLKEQLRSEERHLPDSVEQRLRASRQRACEQSRSFHLPRFLLPATGMTLASVLALTLILAPGSLQQAGDTGSASLDMLQTQELDFYYWLAETQDVAGS